MQFIYRGLDRLKVIYIIIGIVVVYIGTLIWIGHELKTPVLEIITIHGDEAVLNDILIYGEYGDMYHKRSFSIEDGEVQMGFDMKAYMGDKDRRRRNVYGRDILPFYGMVKIGDTLYDPGVELRIHSKGNQRIEDSELYEEEYFYGEKVWVKDRIMYTDRLKLVIKVYSNDGGVGHDIGTYVAAASYVSDSQEFEFEKDYTNRESSNNWARGNRGR